MAGSVVLLAAASLLLSHGQPGACQENLARGKDVSSSKYLDNYYGPGGLVVDGDDTAILQVNGTPKCLFTQRNPNPNEAFAQVDLGFRAVLDHVVVIFRLGGDRQVHEERRNGYSIFVSTSEAIPPVSANDVCYHDANAALSEANHENRTCSNVGRYVTIYNRRDPPSRSGYSKEAILELCEVKAMGCPIRKFGSPCKFDCSANCVDTLCFPANGACMRGCKAGYTGDYCGKQCMYGYFGTGCLDQCFCKTDTCNHESGICPPGGCDPGYTGVKCDTSCSSGYFGDLCQQPCGQCKDGATCNNIDGSCAHGCQPGYQIPNCINVCSSGWYGDRCAVRCGNCLDGVTCHHVNGTCTTGCAPGWMGTQCFQACNAGKFGPNCEQTCGNCYNGVDCVITDGSCPRGCSQGWQGPTCKQVCGYGKYGVNCSLSCGKCRDQVTCDRFSGNCTKGCEPGWNGTLCQSACAHGWYGLGCLQRCGNCMSGNICHHVNGICPTGSAARCEAGWKGETCKTKCENTEYGYDCGQTCGRCRNSSCEPQAGNCTQGCLDGWAGGQCQQSRTAPTPPPPTSPAGLVGGIVAAVVAIIAVIIIVVLVKRRKQNPSSSTPHHIPGYQKKEVLYENMKEIGERTNDPEGQTYENIGDVRKQKTGIRVAELATVTARKDNDGELTKEYKDFPTGSQFPCTEGQKPENKLRNRYKTTFPYDHSRVMLEGGQGYINANFIQSLEKTHAYVATQGPKKNTIGDFWRMIWQLKTGKIIMLANCVEVGKPKVHQYWPDVGSPMALEGLQISYLSSKDYAAYSVRKLKLEDESTDETRVITQFHFTKWPDHGTPDVMHFALLHSHVTSEKSSLDGPMVVHCSAGVGRTGTFIALDVLFRDGKVTGYVDPQTYVKVMRKDRVSMVQTAEQYTFIYYALVELFLIDNTTLTMNDFGPQSLKAPRLQDEYKKLNGQRPTLSDDELADGMMQKNQPKNRDPDILPGSSYRPLLSSPAANKTDYINAVFLSSAKEYRGYIVTQWPLPDTADDFWAMVYDYGSTAVVILDSDANTSDPKLMPTQKDPEIFAGNFTVQTETDPSCEGTVSSAEGYLTKKGGDNSQKLKIFTIADWPFNNKPCKTGDITQTVYTVQEWQRRLPSPGPITVVCRNGSSKCGIFCSVASAIENINLCHHVSLVQVVRQLQNRRPSFINTMDSYAMCNREVKVHFDSLSEYQNYEGSS